MMVGMAIGNHDRDEANQVFTGTVAAAVILGVALLLVGIVWLKPLTDLLCPDEGLQGLTSEYLSITLYGGGVLSIVWADGDACCGGWQSAPCHISSAVICVFQCCV